MIELGIDFRAHMRDGTALGKEAKAFIARGDLVPDSVMVFFFIFIFFSFNFFIFSHSSQS